MNKAILSLTLFLLALCGNIRAQQADTLSIRQQNIVAIAANTATSDLGKPEDGPCPRTGFAKWESPNNKFKIET